MLAIGSFDQYLCRVGPCIVAINSHNPIHPTRGKADDLCSPEMYQRSFGLIVLYTAVRFEVILAL